MNGQTDIQELKKWEDGVKLASQDEKYMKFIQECNTMEISIIDANYIGASKFEITFNDGIKKEVDINAFLKSNPLYFNAPIFQPLKNEAFLACFRVENATLTWNNNIDIAPDQLYQFVSQEKIWNG